MSADNRVFRELYEKYVAGTCSEEERVLVESSLLSFFSANEPFPEEDTLQQKAAAILENMNEKLGKDTGSQRPLKSRRWLPYAAAAGIIAAFSLGMYLNLGTPRTDNPIENLKPGGSKAVLTLANGQTIGLSSEQSGIAMTGNHIHYIDGSSVTGSAEDDGTSILRLSTPRGGQYQVVLDDGTNVWLNAASTLTYPSRFTGDVREISVEGEAYISVNNRRSETGRKPFIVKSGDLEIRVLGTEFNVAAYPDNDAIRTTLVSGSLQVAAAGEQLLLAAGEQATLSLGKLTKAPVDVHSTMAWKQGRISLEGKTTRDLMNELARWYDFEVVYEGTIPEGTFFGETNRDDNLSMELVTNLLESAQLQYRVEGKRLIIRAK